MAYRGEEGGGPVSIWTWLLIICIAAPIALVGLSMGIGALWAVLSLIWHDIWDDIGSRRRG